MSHDSQTPPVLAFLITAAGSGTRMGEGLKKEFRLINNKPVIRSTLEAFTESSIFTYGLITCKPGTSNAVREIISSFRNPASMPSPLILCDGGKTRQESVYLGLKRLEEEYPDLQDGGFVLIHDGARPWITPELIGSVADGCIKTGACAPVIPSINAMKKIDSNRVITAHLSRVETVGIQTPQGFRFSEILRAHKEAINDGRGYIDDTEIYNTYINRVTTIPGDINNKKITYSSDIPEGEPTGEDK